MKKFALIAAPFLLAATLPTAAQAVEVLPGDSSWSATSPSGGATAAITGTYVPGGASQTGSLEFKSNGNSGKAQFVHQLTNVTVGDLVAGGSISFDFYRASSSSSADHFAPVVRLAFSYGFLNLQTGYLIWEAVYNGFGNVAEDTWVTADLTNAYFYERRGSDLGIYDKTLADYDPNLKIKSIEIGVGSGWGGSFYGAADNLMVDMGNKGVLDVNFNPTAAPVTAPVPEPMTWMMFIMGFGLVGSFMRRRKTFLRPSFG